MIEIVGPPDPEDVRVVDLIKHNKVLVYCDCDVTFDCPQGKRGAQTRCGVWMELSHVTQKAIDASRAMRRYTR